MNPEKKTYEGMFLMDSGSDFAAISQPVRSILERREAEILAFKPWDDRKLCFEIKGRKRGLYILVYFKANPLYIVEIEHDCALDERVLRSMILRRDELTEVELNAQTPATSAPAPVERVDGEGAAPAGAAPAAAPTAVEGIPAAEIADIPDILAADDAPAAEEEK